MVCSNCGNVIKDEDSDCLDINHNHICSDCAENHYVRCSNCGGLVHESEVFYSCGTPYCSSCFEDCDDDDCCDDDDDDCCDDSYFDEHDIQGYHCFDSKRIKFFGDTHNNTFPLMGIELEIDKGNGNNGTVSREICDIMPEHFIHFEHDGSLHDGFENITQPATLEYHKSIKDQYKAMFKLAIHNGYRSHNTRTCGLHVHFNRTFFKGNEDLYVTRLLFFVEKFWDELTKFSRRKLDTLHWAKKYDDKPDAVIRKEKGNNLDRYYAINLTNDNTIEFRIFRGTLKYSTFMATLQLVNNMICLAKTIPEDALQSVKWEDLLTTKLLKDYWETVKDRVVK